MKASSSTGALPKMVCERYLYMNENKTKWLITENPVLMSLPDIAVPMTASVSDSAEDPRNIVGTWQVYDETVGKYRPYHRLTTQEELQGVRPTDRLRIVETSGVELSVCSCPMVVDGCFLRQASEVNGRPVYEMENGGQFLYWITTDGKPLPSESGADSGTALLGHPLHSDKGFWCISDTLGAQRGSSKDGNWAFVNSSAATPDEINESWQTWQDNLEYRADPSLTVSVMKDSVVEGGVVDEGLALLLGRGK